MPDVGDPVVKPGDLVVIDEAWNFWGEEHQLSYEHRNFFRMLRHLVDDKGQACQLLVMIQDYESLHRFLRRVVGNTTIFRKMSSLGFMNRYQARSFEGRPRRETLLSTSPWLKYDPAVFACYKSFDGDKGGSEKLVDARGNLFKDRKFWLFTGGALILCVVFVSITAKRVYGWMHPQSAASSAGFAASSPQAAASGVPLAAARVAKPSSSHRIVGLVTLKSGLTVALVSDGSTVRRFIVSGGVLDGWSSFVDMDGERVFFESTFGKASK